MKKRDPLSTAETMKAPTSPRQKPSMSGCPRAGFFGGLMDEFWDRFNVSEMDTFLEKPFSVHSFLTTEEPGAPKSRRLKDQQKPPNSLGNSPIPMYQCCL